MFEGGFFLFHCKKKFDINGFFYFVEFLRYYGTVRVDGQFLGERKRTIHFVLSFVFVSRFLP